VADQIKGEAVVTSDTRGNTMKKGPGILPGVVESGIYACCPPGSIRVGAVGLLGMLPAEWKNLSRRRINQALEGFSVFIGFSKVLQKLGECSHKGGGGLESQQA